MRKLHIKTAMVLGIVLSAGTANAAAYVGNAVVDLSQNTPGVVLGINVDKSHISGTATPPLLAGDTLSGHVTFANNGIVTIYNDVQEYVQFWVANQALSSNLTYSDFQFTGLSGNLIPLNDFSGGFTGCCAGSGPLPPSNLTSSSFSFTGFDYSFNFRNPHDSFSPYIFFTSKASYTDDLTSGVPEPSTWAMMVLGFGGIGFAMRRRRVRALQVA